MSDNITYKDLAIIEKSFSEALQNDRHEARKDRTVFEHELNDTLKDLVKTATENTVNLKNMSKILNGHMDQEEKDRKDVIDGLKHVSHKNDGKLSKDFFWKAEGIRTAIAVIFFSGLVVFSLFLYDQIQENKAAIGSVKGDTREILRVLSEDFE